jgi:phosphoenolpyruvate---glycerone phosphotransferase subunit DhaL
MTREITAQDHAAALGAVAALLAEKRDELCRLDGLIGDGDHGIAMATGFAAAAKAAGALDAATATVADVYNAAAKALLNAIGASSGPLYATALMRAAKAAGPRAATPFDETPKLIAAMAEGIRTRGQANEGDKTMLDAWAPAARAGEEALARSRSPGDVVEAIGTAAEAGAEATKAMVATKGRSARLGERSLGHIDPGAASAVLVIETLTGEWLRRAQA